MKDSILICFIGIDGSGKTTQAKALFYWLKKSDIDVRYTWNRFDPKLMKIVEAFAKVVFSKPDISNFDRYENFLGKKKMILKNRFIGLLYQTYMVSEYLLYVLFKLRPESSSGRVVICDRYVHDLATLLAMELGYTNEQLFKLFHFLMAFTPKPTVIFLLDLPEEIAYKRKTEQPKRILKEKREAYLALGRFYNTVKIDGSKNFYEINKQIKGVINDLLSVKSEHITIKKL